MNPPPERPPHDAPRIFGPGLPSPPQPPDDAPLANPPRTAVTGEVVGERENADAEARRRSAARTPSIALAAPAFLFLLFALGPAGRGAGATAGNPLAKIILTAALCLAAALCFTILAAKAESQPGRIAWVAGILAAAVIFLQALVANI